MKKVTLKGICTGHRRLLLRVETVRKLTSAELENVAGGGVSTQEICTKRSESCETL